MEGQPPLEEIPGKHLECVRMSNRTVVVVLCNVIVSFVSRHGHVFFLCSAYRQVMAGYLNPAIGRVGQFQTFPHA